MYCLLVANVQRGKYGTSYILLEVTKKAEVDFSKTVHTTAHTSSVNVQCTEA